jgi:hypothetical protein
MNRIAHTTTSAPNYTALLSIRTLAKTQTTLIRAKLGQGLTIGLALPTQALPGITKAKTMEKPQNEKLVTELIDHLDELIDQIDRYHEALTNLLKELDPNYDK